MYGGVRGAPYRRNSVGPSTRLADALLSVQSGGVSMLVGFPKELLLEVLIVKFAISPCGGKNKFVKKGRVDFWVEKKHSLEKWLVALACSVFYECVFCGWAFSFVVC